ncbi:MAG TPA: DUF2852 domain-containing protein [Beijerinckiaceae bacterium]|jgi:hypothetical protein|nr:DUF2852 domain-containing protein [Beijerinckiaceae bacterium]
MSATAEWADNDRGQGRRGRCEWKSGHYNRVPWRPLELVAMILGFIVFWPIGLAILMLKIWQKRSGQQGDLVSFANMRFDEARERAKSNWRGGPWQFGNRDGGNGGFGGGPNWGRGADNTGNRAFDEWRTAELERIEEERRKLEAAQREFGEYLAHLRMARDRDEFERFKRERSAAQARGESGWKPFDDTKSDGNGQPQ